MEYKVVIKGRLPSLNQYIDKCRENPFLGAKMKQQAQEVCEWCIAMGLKKKPVTSPVWLKYVFYEPNKKRDLDNISGFAHKVIQDALVEQHVIQNDGWNDIVGYEDCFAVDAIHPRIELIISEVNP